MLYWHMKLCTASRNWYIQQIYRHAKIEQIKIGRTYVSDLRDLESPWGTPWGVCRGGKMDICHSRLPENAFTSTRKLKMSLKNLEGMDMEEQIWKS